MRRHLGGLVLSVLAIIGGLAAAPQQERGRRVPVEHAVLKLIREVELPVREAGVLAEYLVQEGDLVTPGQVVARMDDRLAQRSLQKAQIELSAARETATRTAPLELARKKQGRESRRLQEQQTLARIGERQAENEIPRQIAERTLEKADVDLRRVTDARNKVANSISEKDFEQYRLAFDKGRFDLEQAKLDQELGRLKAQALQDAVRGQELEVESATLEVDNARSEQEQARLQQELKEADVGLRQVLVDFHKLQSPLEGVVVERHHQPGEWLEPGERVLRIIHLRKLRAEGYLSQELASPGLLGRRAELTVILRDGRQIRREGTVVHLGSEVDPVKLDVKVWVEIDNNDLQLRPGMQGNLELELPE